MTMKLGRSPMDPDLDSFLNSSTTTIDYIDDDDDDDLHTSPHRTVDDILNDYDFSSSPSSVPPPSRNHSHLSHSQSSSDDQVSEPKSDAYPLREKIGSRGDGGDSVIVSSSCSRFGETLMYANERDVSVIQSRTGSFSRVSSGEFSGDSFSIGTRFGRPLPPPLFGSFRSNANKPGAALAAAAAASRSIPTPHAAAIKFRRAGSVTMQKVLYNDDLGSVVSDDSDFISGSGTLLEGLGPPNGISLVTTHVDDDKIVEENKKRETFRSKENTIGGIFQSVDIQGVEEVDNIGKLLGGEEIVDVTRQGNELVSKKETPPAGVHELEANELTVNDSGKVLFTSNVESEMGSSIKLGTDFDKDRESAASGSIDVEDQHIESSSPDENGFMDGGNSSSLEAANSVEQGFTSLHGSAKDQKFKEDSKTMTIGVEESEKDMVFSNDGEAGLAGEESSSGTDVSELVEGLLVQLENKRDIRKVGKKLRTAVKPLELAEELEKKHASTGLHWEEGAVAQPMRLEGVRRGSTVLGYFHTDADNTMTRTISSQAFRRDHGSPQVVAVHPIFIAVGMSKGLVIVIPSRYSAQNADNMDSKMLMLGLQGDRSHAPVTSVSFNQQGDLLLAGYGDGHITVWDVQRTAAAKVITGEHAAPVVHTFFLGQDSRQFIAVTGDSKGLVFLHEFSSSMISLLNRFSTKTKCILDGQRGKVLAASPLLLDGYCGGGMMCPQGSSNMSSSSLGSKMGGVVGGDAGWKLFSEGSSLVEEGVVIFVTYQTALVIRLTPTRPEVYAQLSKPDGVREGSMPYVAWKCTMQAHSSSTEALEKVSLLAIVWDRKVQVTKMVKSELKICGKWTLESVAIGVAWLDDQMLVILTLTGQLCLFAKDGSLIHKTSFYMDGSEGEDLIMYHTHFINIFGNPEKSYHHSVAVRGASIYILGPSHLIVSRLLPWKERILVLRKAGDWMGALNMAMTIYDGEAHGVIDLPRMLDAVQEAIMPFLVELLLSYVDEVFSYISVAFCNQLENMEQHVDSKSTSSTGHSEMKEQFTRVGGVAVEFCVHIKKADILFDEIYSKFVAVQQRETFLELLEPYILKDMLGFLPPEVMQALVEHYSSKGWLQRVEQCVLHMDISSLDFNQVVKLCREHGLYGALVYLFNRGLDDFNAPLEELLTVLRNSPRESAAPLGYRMLVYLKYCFTGLAFPPGHGTLPLKRLPSLRIELVQFLLEETQTITSLSSTEGSKNVYYLLELDTEATLDVLRCAFDEDKSSKPLHDSPATLEAGEGNDSIYKSNNLLVQKTVDVLVHILDKAIPPKEMSSASDKIASVKTWPLKRDIGHVFDFIAYYVACLRACVSKSVLDQILEYLTSVSDCSPCVPHQYTEILKKREKQVLALLEVLLGTDWDESYVLCLSEKAHFYQVCALIYTFRQQYLVALDSYMKDIDEPIHAFSFIHNTLLQLRNSTCAAFRSAVISRIPELVNLSREGTFFMVINHFNKENSPILAELRPHPKSLFLYLKTVIEVHLSGTLNFACLKKGDVVDIPSGRRTKDQSNGIRAYLERIDDFSKILRNNPVSVNDEMVELYLELLCQYEQNSVLKFLQTFESYRVEHCLRLCQEYRIIDAAAFLLERVGDVGSALLLTLSGLDDKFYMLDTALESVLPDVVLSGLSSIEHFSTILRIKEVNEIHDILHSCIGLCQRNSPRLDPEDSKFLWFRLLDSFCTPFMDSCNDKMFSEGEIYAGMLAQSDLDRVEIIKWRISKSHRSALVLKRLFSLFIKEIVEGMMGHVHLPTVMSKLLSDNSSQEFGDFKLTIMGMLGTYGFEKRILDTAKSLIEDDAFYTMSLLKKGASHGYAPQILICCICNCRLAKNSSSSSMIRVFNCGHSTHLQCELHENETSSRGSYSGCPVCMPKKKAHRSRGKSIFAETSLVNKFSSRSQKAQGAHVLLPFNCEAQENPYGHQLVSRFEILTDLHRQQRSIRIENVPQLRLAPPAIYHEKVKKGTDFLTGESSSGPETIEKLNRHKQLRELKVKGSSIRFPLKSSIFGKEKSRKR